MCIIQGGVIIRYDSPMKHGSLEPWCHWLDSQNSGSKSAFPPRKPDSRFYTLNLYYVAFLKWANNKRGKVVTRKERELNERGQRKEEETSSFCILENKWVELMLPLKENYFLNPHSIFQKSHCTVSFFWLCTVLRITLSKQHVFN